MASSEGPPLAGPLRLYLVLVGASVTIGSVCCLSVVSPSVRLGAVRLRRERPPKGTNMSLHARCGGRVDWPERVSAGQRAEMAV